MLQAMRSGAQSKLIKYTIYGLLLFAMLGLALVSGHDYESNGLAKSFVAKVDGDKVSVPQFDQMVQTNLRQNNVPQAKALESGIPYQVLTQEINGRIFGKAAQDLGLRVDDATAARQIKTMLTPLTQKGVSDKDALKQFLQAYGITENQLVSSIKTQIAQDTLMRALGEGVSPPEQMVNDALKFRYESRQAQYVTLTAADAAKIAAPTDEDLQKTYAAMKADIMQPETRDFAVLTVNPKAFAAADVNVTEADAKSYYDTHPKEFGAEETRTISQAVVKDEDLAKKLAADGLKASKDVKVLSGTYTAAQLPEDLSKAVYATAEGATAQPVKSPLGWHVIHVDKITKPAAKSFDSVKASLIKKLHDEKAAEALYAKADEIDEQLATGKSLADVASELNLKEVTFNKITADKKDIAGLPMADKVMAAAFKLRKDEVSQLMETPNGEFVIVEVRNVVAAAPKSFDSVRADVVKAWEQKQRSEALQAKAEKATASLKNGGSFDKAAAELGKSVQQTGMILRGQKHAHSPAFLTALFSIGGVGQTIVVPEGDSVTLIRLADRKIDMPDTPKKEDIDSLRMILGRSMQNDILEQYRKSLMKDYSVVVNEDVVAKMYTPQAEDEQP